MINQLANQIIDECQSKILNSNRRQGFAIAIQDIAKKIIAADKNSCIDVAENKKQKVKEFETLLDQFGAHEYLAGVNEDRGIELTRNAPESKLQLLALYKNVVFKDSK